MCSSPIRSILCIAVVNAVTLLPSPDANGDDWILRNGTERTFYVHIRPSSLRRDVGFNRYVIPPNATTAVPVPADRDPFDVQFETRIEGGDDDNREIFVPCLKPLPLHQYAANQSTFHVDRLVLAAMRLPSGDIAVEGTLKVASPRLELDFGDHKGFRGELSNSTWNTTFVSGNEQSTNARLRLDGKQGTFSTSSFNGTLENVKYSFDGDMFYIDGTWKALGSGGRFLFEGRRTQPKYFSGKWRYDNANEWRDWSGTR